MGVGAGGVSSALLGMKGPFIKALSIFRVRYVWFLVFVFFVFIYFCVSFFCLFVFVFALSTSHLFLSFFWLEDFEPLITPLSSK